MFLILSFILSCLSCFAYNRRTMKEREKQQKRGRGKRRIRERELWKRFRVAIHKSSWRPAIYIYINEKVWNYKSLWSSVKLQKVAQLNRNYRIVPIWISTLPLSKSMNIYNAQLRKNTRYMPLWTPFVGKSAKQQENQQNNFDIQAERGLNDIFAMPRLE